jgi:phage terminase large subunit-like protein
MPATMTRKDPRGGHNAKSLEQHKREGTYRADRHKPEVPTAPLLAKPRHCAAKDRHVPPEWIHTRADELARDAGCWFELPFAEHVRKFARKFLRLWEGDAAGKPFELLAWQWERVIAPLFGWFRWDEQRQKPVRRFNTAYIEVPKKQGKSPLAALVGVYLMAGDGEGGSSVFSAATTQRQAGIVHNHALNMIKASEEMNLRCKLNRSTHAVTYLPTDSIYRSISSDAGGAEGLNGHCIIDELHAWDGRAFFDALRYMGASRSSPVLFAITTAGDDMASVCREQHDYGQAVNRGDITDSGFLCYITAASNEDDPGDEATWQKANPSYGKIIFRDEMARAYQQSKQTATQLSAFKRYRLNVWATATNPWLNIDDWLKCGEDYTEADLQGQPCYAGLDLSASRDMTALSLVFPGEYGYRVLPHFWVPEKVVEEKSNVVPYRDWIAGGHVTVCPGEVMDYEWVEAKIAEVSKRFKVMEIAYDAWHATELEQNLTKRHRMTCVKFPQVISNFAMPTAELLAMVKSGKFAHNRNPVLTWQAGHCNVYTDPSGNTRPVKPKQGDDRKIDGIVATIMALARAMHPDRRKVSVYASQGIRSFG